jgi:PRC-barrel domain
MLRNLLVTTGMLLAIGAPAFAQTDQSAAAAGAPVITQQDESQVRVDRLVGTKAVGPDGQTIGKIDDLLLDRDQKLAGVIVGVGGFLGVGSKWVALPTSRVDISKAYGDERVVKVDATKEELAAAPAFKTRETMKAEAEQQAARARALQNAQTGPGAPGVPRPMPAAPAPSGGSSTQ